MYLDSLFMVAARNHEQEKIRQLQRAHMPSTHLSLHYHLVFSTKERRPLIENDWRPDLYSYMGGCLRQIDGVAESIGGVEDHVHLLIGLRATHRLCDVLRDIKRASSIWIRDHGGHRAFEWQEGYGAFTVSVSNLDRVRRYIQNQEEHHKRQTYADEYISLLRRHGVPYEEKHLW